MKSIKSFLEEILIDMSLEQKIKSDEISTAKIFLDKLNKYFYQTNKENEGYISDFHQYWEHSHEEIISPIINEKQATKIAKKFDEVF